MTIGNDDERMMTERELAERTRISPRTWQQWRGAGGGPPYVKIGRAVRYRWSQVEAWIASQSTGPTAA